MGSIRSILLLVLVVALFHTSLSVKDGDSNREHEDRSFLPDFSKELTAEERDEKELDQDEPGSDEDSGIKEDPFEETLDEFVPNEKQDESSSEKEKLSESHRERNDHDTVKEQSNENDIVEDIENSIEMKKEAQREELMDEERSKENMISEDDVADNETMENVENEEEVAIEKDSDKNMLGERKMSKNEMINRVRKYAMKHGISLKEFRRTVMEFKAKSRVTGEEFHPKNIFKIIKDKIEQIKREPIDDKKSSNEMNKPFYNSNCKKNSDCVKGQICSIIAFHTSLSGPPVYGCKSVIPKSPKQERQPLDATSSIATSSHDIAEQSSQQRFRKAKPMIKPMPKGGMSKKPRHPKCINDDMCKNVLKSEDARCGPLHRCYIAKPCNSESDCSPNYECLSPSEIKANKAEALRRNILRHRNKKRLARRQRSRKLRKNGRKAARFGGMQSVPMGGRKIRRNLMQRNLPSYHSPSLIERQNREKREATDDENEIDEKNDSELINDIDDDEDILGLDMEAPLEREDLENVSENENGMDVDIEEKFVKEMEDEAASGAISDRSLSDERSEQQGGLTDSVSTSDEDKKSTKTAEAKERNIERKEVHVQPEQTSEQRICVLKRPPVRNPMPILKPVRMVPRRGRAMTGLSLQTNRIGRRPQVLSAMGQPQAPLPIKPRKKVRGSCFGGVLQRLMKSDFTDEEKEKAKLLLARLFPRLARKLEKKQSRLDWKKAQNFPELPSANIPSDVAFEDKMARSDEGDSGPALDTLPDFSTPERNSRKELGERIFERRELEELERL